MALLRNIAAGLRSLLRRERVDRELDEEMRACLEMAADEKVKRGMSRADAIRAVRLEMGDIQVAKETVHAAGWESFVETCWQDLRFGGRLLRRSPGFTVVAVLTLGLGIGANAAIFSYINAWVIKPLPYPQSDRLMMFESHDKKKGWTTEGLTSTASFLDFQKQNTSFEQTALWRGWNFNLTGDGDPVLVEGGQVSWNFFAALGARPIRGRTFVPDEDRPGAARVAMIGEGLWQSRFGGDSNIVGRDITIGGEAYTIVGVMPASFQFPLMGLASLWTPLALSDQQRADRSNSSFSAFGRLKPGVKQEQGEAESGAIFGRLESQFPQTNANLTLLVSSMNAAISRKEGAPELLIAFCIVGLILLIACANIANLMLTRAANRAREFAVRAGLGATRVRLLRQVLTESLLLFLLGGVAGTVFGLWGVRWIDSQIPNHVRGYVVNYGHVDLDFTTLGFTMAITVLCGLVFGLAPARENSPENLDRTLKDASRQSSGSRRSARLRRIFVASEIGLAIVVLISTTLLVKSFIISVRSSPGYNPANVMVAQLALPKIKYAQDSHLRNFSDDVLARLRALPAANSVGVASSVPFGGFGSAAEISPADKPLPEPAERLGARFFAVSADYFPAMQIELVKGRFFNSIDSPGNPFSVIVNETVARQLWPDQDPIGRELRFGEQHIVCVVVGIVRDVKMYHLRERPTRQIYVPLEQFPSATLSFVVRTTSDPTTMAGAVRDTIWAVDRDQPISSVEPLETLMAVTDAGNRTLTKLMVFFGVLATFLGVIGIYGVMSDLVAQRTREIGIRTALGASPGQMMSMVIGQGLKLAFLGVVPGVLCALAATRAFAAILYQVGPNDPLTFLLVPVIFIIVGTAACYIPARRAMRVDPVVALRYE